MQALRRILLAQHQVFFTSFSTRPSKLFEGAEQRLTIFVQTPNDADSSSKLFSAGYLKWSTVERPYLFELLEYVAASPAVARKDAWPKTRGSLEAQILQKMTRYRSLAQSGFLGGGAHLYYKNTGLRYFNTVTLNPPRCRINGKETSSSRETVLDTETSALHVVHCYLLSTAFFMYYQMMSNCRDLNPSDITLAPLPPIQKPFGEFKRLSGEIERDYTKKSRTITMNNKLTGMVELQSISPARSKEFLDRIDTLLASYFQFTEEELDFIINYDIKLRVGPDAESEDE
jgi:hypothetical protein